MIVNAPKLDRELRTAGIPIHGVDSNGNIQFRIETTQEQRNQANIILAKHDPTPLTPPLTTIEKLMNLLLVKGVITQEDINIINTEY